MRYKVQNPTVGGPAFSKLFCLLLVLTNSADGLLKSIFYFLVKKLFLKSASTKTYMYETIAP